jgi:tRNA(Ile)-lysidine synthase TilS/MesJ
MNQEKIVETKSCKHCSNSFDITDKDLEFYEKISPIFKDRKYSITTPTLCPDCRQQRRQAFKNIYNLYKNEEI